MRMGHPNEGKVRDIYAAMARGDGRALAASIRADAVWHIPGRSQLAGTYTGLDEVFDFWRRVAEMSDDGLRLQVLDVLANDERAAVFVHGRASRGGHVLEERGVHHLLLQDGRIAEAWFYYQDQDAYDAFWNG
jgi:uncharacterized protein